MLDQNTDRMWYVIGAVIIGAAIIFILNGTMPELFASVGGTFNHKAKETTDIVDGIGPKTPLNELDFNMKNIRPSTPDMSYNWLSDTAIQISPNEGYQGGVYIPAKYFDIDGTYAIEFTIQKLSGDIKGVGGHLLISEHSEVTIDGQSTSYWDAGVRPGENNNLWSRTVVYPNDNEKHMIRIVFTKTMMDEQYMNDNVYIQPNRTDASRYSVNALDYDVIIENIKLYHHD